MYAFAREPWKTQRHVREIMNREYHDVPGGLSGNEDAGQMSAWYLFSSLGFYPVCPVSPYYVIGSPSLDRVQIGEFVIVTENASAENVYIQSATYNGQPYTKNYVTLDMLKSDGLLKFVMGPKPNKNWGCHAEDCPPDLSLN
jgi:putative alpha-1,2-mannosidase